MSFESLSALIILDKQDMAKLGAKGRPEGAGEERCGQHGCGCQDLG